ncbi:hypothetical protein PVAND_002419 [Polypedilum vanderplanki]|uniref:BPL/LPL catalytic domain-containing protein n=1 Tax=Polypedilum vanderplanki TaxID=319348 RepID=A0A9J6BRA6_POLVA|nr:hypothetical protein PVAND_002419 [Polypedilum vanderplanki]
MIFTFYYLAATSFQSWRLRSIHQKIARVLDNNNSIVFLKKSDENSHGMATVLAASEICSNSGEAVVHDCFWSNDLSQAISVTPKQILYINPFITFPIAPNLIPFSFGNTNIPDSTKNDVIHALIEADLNTQENANAPALEIEAFAHMIAWKIDSKLSVLVKTDLKHLSQLIFATFIHNHYIINDQLSLTRIQTVNVEGEAQDINEILKHSKKDILLRSSELLSPTDWEKHLDGIKSLGVLANQASEFKYKKNLTEGKTGVVVQPDLISSKTIEESLIRKNIASPDTPKKNFVSLEKTNEKIQELKQELKKKHDATATSTSSLSSYDSKSVEAIISPDSPKFPVTPSKSPSQSIKSRISNEPTSPKFPVQSPAKKAFFGNESKSASQNDVRRISDTAKNLVDSVIKEAKEIPDVVDSQKKISEKVEKVKSDVKEATKSFLNNEQEKSENLFKSETVGMPKSKVEKTIFEDKKVEEIKKDIKKEEKPEIFPVKREEIKEEIKTLTPVQQQLAAPDAPIATNQSKHYSQSNKTKRQKLIDAKPPNVLVYSDSTTTRNNVIKTLGGILKENMYTIYPLSAQQMREKIWLENTTLLVVCGSVNGSDISKIFLEFFFKGGKILCLCSDLLRQVLPTYHTAEVREHELVQFSYGQWKNIKMMHHIFCYQPSPVRKHFSQESDEPPKEKPSNANPSIELKDDVGLVHNVNVQILGTEDTWKTPSLLMVYTDNGGKIVFSQIHLEIDPSFYENDEQKYQILMKNDNLRHEIFGDVLSTHLGLSSEDVSKKSKESRVEFTKAYFLGRHELKFEILEQLKSKMEGNALKVNGLTMKFCGKNDDPPTPESYMLPIMVHLCPDDFSTLDYFDTLKTEKIGRLMIYSHVLESTMNMVNKIKYSHGMAIVSRVISQATGRGNNQWLSPPGCLMFTLQLHISLSSPLGQRISLIQHLVATAVVTGLKKIPGYSKVSKRKFNLF